MDKDNTYWNGKGKYRKEANELALLVPKQGEAKTVAVETYRKAVNMYYDLYNNGLNNFTPFQFHLMFNIDVRDFKIEGKSHNFFMDILYEKVEIAMDKIIKECHDRLTAQQKALILFRSVWNKNSIWSKR